MEGTSCPPQNPSSSTDDDSERLNPSYPPPMYSGYTTQQGPTQLSYTAQSDYPTQLGGYHLQGYSQLPGYHQLPGYYPDPTKDAPPPYYPQEPPQEPPPAQRPSQQTRTEILIQRQPTTYATSLYQPKDHFRSITILVCIICSVFGSPLTLLCTIPAIFTSAQAIEAEHRGDLATATKKDRSTVSLNVAAVIFGLAFILLWVFRGSSFVNN